MRRCVGAIVLLAALVTGCSTTPPPDAGPMQLESFTEVAMGVEVTVTVAGVDAQARLAAARAAMAEVRACDDALSDWQAASECRRLPQRAGERVTVSDRMADAVARTIAMAAATDGRFDPTVAPVIAAWRDARRAGTLPDPALVEVAMTRVGWTALHLDPDAREAWFDRDGVRLDFGGIGKGLAAERASAALTAAGHPCHLVAVAGDIVAGPAPPPGRAGWRIRREDGLGRPVELELLGEAISTSGDLEQFILIGGVRHSHIVDPRTGRALTVRTAASVRGPSGATCDALATALCVAGTTDAPRVMARFPGYRAMVTSAGDAPPAAPGEAGTEPAPTITTWSTRPAPGDR